MKYQKNVGYAVGGFLILLLIFAITKTIYMALARAEHRPGGYICPWFTL